ncbi:MAG: hypothetical protein A2571_01560 [Candidatus Vogelbacteria bacterium RIFOXYD1_FULL_44_32]|uniref:DUF1648 domain-containing protein n=1 Tax=Candidatus Vogelbacteria bacterium RIFOXYD1_FULL_44_32 TaxID=1802438 RepID=A0A1G2QDD4_9BACT|nr:MAG: hypothetical protein A2571_01560 [Candidatus Vogelbacteria bacterium RIFOXYD1_FULL_44_32]
MKNKAVKNLYLITGLFSIVPFFIYYWEAMRGRLPDPDVWFMDSNHGPWRYELQGFLVLNPILLLLLITGILFLKNVFKLKENKDAAFYLGSLIVIQILVLLLQLFVMGWTID